MVTVPPSVTPSAGVGLVAVTSSLAMTAERVVVVEEMEAQIETGVEGVGRTGVGGDEDTSLKRATWTAGMERTTGVEGAAEVWELVGSTGEEGGEG